MKKVIALSLMLVLLLSFSACAVPSATPENNEAPKTQQLPAPTQDETVSSEKEEESVSPEQPAKNNEDNTSSKAPSQNESAVSDKTQKNESTPVQPQKEESTPATEQKQQETLLSRQRAVEIALQSAGLSANEVFDLDAELDREVYGVYWEVDFETRETEYSFEIDAVTGKILRQEKERND